MIVGLCPTFGRATMLGEMVASWLDQRHATHLLILNDGKPLAYDHRQVTIYNDQRYPTLGHKRNRLLTLAQETFGNCLVAHADDDDLYLPDHLSQLAKQLQTVAAAKNPLSIHWQDGKARFSGKGSNDGALGFHLAKVIELGGYAETQRGQIGQLVDAFKSCNQLRWYKGRPSYIYRWHDCHTHLTPDYRPQDFGSGRLVVPDIKPTIRKILGTLKV